MTTRVRIIGAGRAGGSFARALDWAGWDVDVAARAADPTTAALGVDLVLLCVPDPTVAEVAAAITPSDEVVVAHCAGSLTLGVLAPHVRRCSIHPLVSLPSGDLGAARMRTAWFAVAGDPMATRVVAAVGGRAIRVAEEHRVTYHAAAVVASNHVVALLGQVERIAADVGVPFEAFLDLAIGSIDSVAELGPRAALTGPVARGDWATVRRHLAVLPADERRTYFAMAAAAARLAGREIPDIDLEFPLRGSVA